MAISFTASGTRTSQAAASSISIAIPNGSVNDVIFLVAATLSNTFLTFSSDWTAIDNQQVTTLGKIYLLAKIAGTATEGNTSATCTDSGGASFSGAVSGQAFRYSGSGNGFAINDYKGNTSFASGTGSPHSNTGVTTTRNNAKAVMIGYGTGNTAYGAVAGWTERVDNGSNTSADHNVVADKDVATSGTGSGTYNPTGPTTAWALWCIEVRELASLDNGGFGRPILDVSAGTWVTSTGSSYFALIDETPASDADYIETTQVPPDICELLLTAMQDPVSSTGHKINVRARSSWSDSLKVTLYQGTTQIATWTQALTSSLTTYALSMTTTEINSISDYRNLRLRFESV